MSRSLATAGAAAVVPVVLVFHSGGYFPSEWGLEVVAFALVALTAVLVVERVELGRHGVALVAGLAGLAVWTLVSIAWSPGADGPVLAAERTLVYVAAGAALLLVLDRERVDALLAGLAGGILLVALYALATRLFVGDVGDAADTLTGGRLAQPLGYANGLGALMAIGLPLALGLASRSGSRVVGIASAAALVPLAVALYFTLSRGSLVALAAGLVVYVLADREGSALGGSLLLAPAPVLGVLLAARSPLTDLNVGLERAQTAGHRLALELGVLVLGAAVTGALAPRLARWLTPWAVVGVAAVAIAAAAAVTSVGPGRIADRALDRFRETPPATSGSASRRLLSVSGNGRSDYWRVAWRMVEREPLVGEGGGSYQRWWLQERPVANGARNAHNLYLETLAELGPVGLALLLLALTAPLGAFRWNAGHPLAAAALGAYSVWLVHATLDWDWQIPAVTLPALAAGGALVVLARPDRAVRRLDGPRRAVAVAAIAPLLAAALVMHVGNRAADRAEAALERGDASRAAAAARRARTWMPWAAQPWQLLGEAELAGRRDASARASLRRATVRDPSSWSAWYDLALVSHGSERKADLARARRLDPLAPERAGLR